MNRRSLLAYLVALPLPLRALSPTEGASAQASSEQLDIDGLVSAYARRYEIDVDAMLEDPPTDMSQVYRSVAIEGYTFESESAAQTYLDEIEAQVIEEEKAADKEYAVTVDELDPAELNGFIYTSNFFTYMDDLVMGLTAVVFVDGNQLYMVWVRDANVETSTRLAMDIALVVSEAEIKTDEVIFSEDGTSSGGVFDRMPAVGDEFVEDLTTVTDIVQMEPAR